MAVGDSYSARMITQQMMYMYRNLTIKQLTIGYANIFDFLNPNSKTFDESDGGRFPQNPPAFGDTGLRDFITFSDSAFDSDVGIQAPDADSTNSINPDLLKKQSFDLDKFDTVYDSNWRT